MERSPGINGNNAGSVIATRGQRSAFQTAGQAQLRAGVAARGKDEDQENQRSLARLDRLLASGEPLRADVPRGFYISINV